MTNLRIIGMILGTVTLGGVMSLMAQPERWFVHREHVEHAARVHWFGAEVARELDEHADALNESLIEASGLRRQVIDLFAGTTEVRSRAVEFSTGPIDDGLSETARRIDQVFRHGRLIIQRSITWLWCAPILIALGIAMITDAWVRRRIRIITCRVPSPLMQLVGRALCRSGSVLMIVLWTWPGIVPVSGVPIATLVTLIGLVLIINHLPRNV